MSKQQIQSKRKRISVLKKMFSGAVTFLLALCLSLGSGLGVQAGEHGSITVRFPEDAEFPKTGVTFHLYRIADGSSGTYTLTDPFDSYPVIVQDLDTDALGTLAQTLLGYIHADSIDADASAQTDSEGKAAFGDLEEGLYLILGDSLESDDWLYTFSPVMTYLPYADAENGNAEEVWDADVTVKYERRRTGRPVDIRVYKVWSDNRNADGNRPESITVRLLQNDTVLETVTLTRENNWTYSWSDLPGRYTYSVAETGGSNGYTVTVNRVGDTFVITNRKTPPETPPETPPGTPPETPPGTPPDTPPGTPPGTPPETPPTGSENTPPQGVMGVKREETEEDTESSTEEESASESSTTGPAVLGAKRIPQTGAEWWVVLVFTAGGLACIVTGLWKTYRHS